jgi:hypothetical protein
MRECAARAARRSRSTAWSRRGKAIPPRGRRARGGDSGMAKKKAAKKKGTKKKAAKKKK